jgi:hypothetical protein
MNFHCAGRKSYLCVLIVYCQTYYVTEDVLTGIRISIVYIYSVNLRMMDTVSRTGGMLVLVIWLCDSATKRACVAPAALASAGNNIVMRNKHENNSVGGDMDGEKYKLLNIKR